MFSEYPYPIVMRNGKRFGKRAHLSRHTSDSIRTINDTVTFCGVDVIQIDFQFYIDIDATMEGLAKRRFQPSSTITEIDLGPDREARRLKNDLFAPKVA
jgi:hypothetical protein